MSALYTTPWRALVATFFMIAGVGCSASESASSTPETGSDVQAELTVAADGARPGEGVTVAGLEISIAMAWSDLVAVAGDPSAVLALTPGELRFTYAGMGIQGTVRGLGPERKVTSLEVLSGAAATLGGELSLGDGPEDARSFLGEPTPDPFLDTWWYPARGLGLVWQEGSLARIVIFAPTPAN